MPRSMRQSSPLQIPARAPIVGEDEADPRRGRISYVSLVARALLESRMGDMVRIGASEATIIRVE
jgi:transcription elongation GreA/GreB family factor